MHQYKWNLRQIDIKAERQRFYEISGFLKTICLIQYNTDNCLFG